MAALIKAEHIGDGGRVETRDEYVEFRALLRADLVPPGRYLLHGDHR